MTSRVWRWVGRPNGMGAAGASVLRFWRALGCAGVATLAASCFAAAEDAATRQTIEWKGPEHRVVADTAYKDATIIARCPVIVEKGCTLTLDNVRMLMEQRVAKEEDRTGQIKNFKNRINIRVEGNLVARGWKLDEISGQKGIPYEISVNLLGTAELTGCALGDRVDFFCTGDARTTATDSTIAGMIQTFQTSRNTFKKCKLGAELPNRYIDTHDISQNTFEDCELSGIKMEIFKSSTNHFTRCAVHVYTWVWGKSVNFFEACTFTASVAFKGETSNELKGCRFTGPGVGFSERAKVRFRPPASELRNVDVYRPGNPVSALHPEISGYASFSLKRFQEGMQITRFFPFTVKDAAQKPVTGAKVQVEVVDKHGRAVSAGVTDKDGLVELGVTFEAANYKEGNFWLVVNGEKKQGLSLVEPSMDTIRLGL